MDELEHYLDEICRRMGGAKSLRQHVRQELREHLLDAAARYGREGLSQSAALARAIGDFGGSDEVRSELEAAYGHRPLAVAIDKVRQWKQQTLNARWLWSSVVHLGLAGVIAVQILLLGFALTTAAPRYFRMLDKGWIDVREYPIGEMGAAGPALASLGEHERMATIDTELHVARASIDDARIWLYDPSTFGGGWDRSIAALREFHEAYARLQAAIKREVTADERP